MSGFRLFAPVMAFEVVPYEPPWTDMGEDLRELSADEVMHCAPVILPEIRDFLRTSDYFSPEKQNEVPDCIMLAIPQFVVQNHTVYLILDCQSDDEIDDIEMEHLMFWWNAEFIDSFAQHIHAKWFKVSGIGLVTLKIRDHGQKWGFQYRDGGDRMGKFPTREEVERLRQYYPAGTRIVLDEMPEDPFPIPPGTAGEVIGVDDAGQVMVKWQNGRSLSLIPGVDSFHAAPELKTSVEQLSLKIKRCFDAFQDEWRGMLPEELSEMADKILAVQVVAEHLEKGVDEEQAAFLLQFQNPLDLVSDEWLSRTKNDLLLVSEELSDITDRLMDAEDLDETYPLEQDVSM